MNTNFVSWSLLLPTFQNHAFTSYYYLYNWKTIFTFQMEFLQISQLLTEISKEGIIGISSSVRLFTSYGAAFFFSGTH